MHIAFIALALAAPMTAPGRYGFPSGKEVLPVATVSSYPVLDASKLSRGVDKCGNNGDASKGPSFSHGTARATRMAAHHEMSEEEDVAKDYGDQRVVIKFWYEQFRTQRSGL